MKKQRAIYIGPTVETQEVFLNFGMTGEYEHCSDGVGFRGFGSFKADGSKKRFVLRSELFIEVVDNQ